MKNFLKIFLVIVAIALIVFLPYLLIIDLKKFTPIVLIVWVFLVAMFLFLRKINKQRNEEEDKELDN